jgi:hypothetical protein
VQVYPFTSTDWTALQNQKRAEIFTHYLIVAVMVRELLIELKKALFGPSGP